MGSYWFINARDLVEFIGCTKKHCYSTLFYKESDVQMVLTGIVYKAQKQAACTVYM